MKSAIEFRDELFKKSHQRINIIVNDRLMLAQITIEQAISFYDTFLECQSKYQEETIEQRLAEKAWVEHQRKSLVQVERGVKLILDDHPFKPEYFSPQESPAQVAPNLK